MKKLLLMVFVSASALLAAGCASSPKDLYSEVQLDWQSSRFMRGEVRISSWRGTDIKGMELKVVYLGLDSGLAQGREVVVLPVPKSLNLQSGDIIDVYRGGEMDEKEYLARPQHLRTQVLGIVCRHDEKGCDYNTTPQLTIGWGRKMRSANEYQGVAAEAKQKIYPGEFNRTDIFTPGWGKPLTTSYARKGISADYEDPPATQQQPHPALCEGYGGCSDE